MTPDALCEQGIKEIVEIIFDWHYTHESGADYARYTLGKSGVIQIKGHVAGGEGDKWFYDVYFENGNIERIFNPSSVIYRTKVKS